MRRKTVAESSTRRGLGLLELLMVITVSAILLGVVITTLNRVLAATSQVQKVTHAGLTIRRLSRMFREDCHNASAAVVDGRELRLSGPNSKQQAYEIGKASIIRTWKNADSSGHDTFRLPALTEGNLLADKTHSTLLLRLRPSVGKQANPAPLEFVIRARVNRCSETVFAAEANP